MSGEIKFRLDGQVEGDYSHPLLQQSILYRLSKEMLEQANLVLHEGQASVTVTNGVTQTCIWADGKHLHVDVQNVQ